MCDATRRRELCELLRRLKRLAVPDCVHVADAIAYLACRDRLVECAMQLLEEDENERKEEDKRESTAALQTTETVTSSSNVDVLEASQYVSYVANRFASEPPPHRTTTTTSNNSSKLPRLAPPRRISLIRPTQNNYTLAPHTSRAADTLSNDDEPSDVNEDNTLDVVAVDQQELAKEVIERVFDTHKNVLRDRLRQLEQERNYWRDKAQGKATTPRLLANKEEHYIGNVDSVACLREWLTQWSETVLAWQREQFDLIHHTWATTLPATNKTSIFITEQHEVEEIAPQQQEGETEKAEKVHEPRLSDVVECAPEPHTPPPPVRPSLPRHTVVVNTSSARPLFASTEKNIKSNNTRDVSPSPLVPEVERAQSPIVQLRDRASLTQRTIPTNNTTAEKNKRSNSRSAVDAFASTCFTSATAAASARHASPPVKQQTNSSSSSPRTAIYLNGTLRERPYYAASHRLLPSTSVKVREEEEDDVSATSHRSALYVVRSMNLWERRPSTRSPSRPHA